MYVWYALLILTLGLSIAVASALLPRLFLKTRYTIKKSGDRGLKITEEKNGRSIVYEPIVKWRKYVKQYVLAERGEKKELMCKIDPELVYLSYDVVLFNNRDEVFDVITVKELIEKKGYTKIVELPSETSYVALTVNKADNEIFPDHVTAKIKAGKIAKFLFLSAFCVLIEVFAVKVCCANIFGGVFRESFVLNVKSTLATLTIAGGLALVNLLISLFAIKIRGRRKRTGGIKKNA